MSKRFVASLLNLFSNLVCSAVSLVCFTSVVCHTLEGAEASKVMKITTIEGISEYRLENGLKVLLFPDPSKPTVTVNLTVFVGSRHEG